MDSRRQHLLNLLDAQVEGCATAGSPFYAEVCEAVADDVRAQGPCWRVLEAHAERPLSDALVLRFLGGIHHLVLTGRAPDLARHYLPDSQVRAESRLRDDLAAVADRSAQELEPWLGRPVQTNEVGRSAPLMLGLTEIARGGLPLSLLELGSSAGLNLLADRYRVRIGGNWRGPADSAVVVDAGGEATDIGPDPTVVARRGCDINPLDISQASDRDVLRAYLWPDQAERRTRLDAAFEVASAFGSLVDRGEADEWLSQRLAQTAEGVATVVMHTIVLQYLPTERRRDVVDRIEAAGNHATAESPLHWLRLEPGGGRAELRLTSWPGGKGRLLARSGFHGLPLDLAPPPAVMASPL